MSDKKIKIEIEGDASSLEQATQKSQGFIQRVIASVGELKDSLKAKASGYFDGLSDELNKVADTVKNVTEAINAYLSSIKSEVKRNLAGLGAAIAAESIIEWRGVKFEAAFADVKKVVSGTVEGIRGLRKELLDMSAEIAMPVEGLAKMQAIAGQLGFPVDLIGDFVRLVAKGAVAFDLLPEKAAESFGNLKNIYDLSLKELEYFGDQINFIADKANTNEANLLDVMNRAGGSAQRFGLLRGETIALAAAMLSMGKPPEIVGTALDRLLSSLQNANNQSKDFKEGLQLLGIDAEKLADNIQRNPKKTLDDFLQTLSKLSAKSQTDILSRLVGEAGEAKGVIGDLVGKIGEYSRLSELAQSSDIAGSMEATFRERQKTVEASMIMMRNAWNSLAISASTLFLPTITAVVNSLRDLALWLRKINEEYPNLAAFGRIALIFSTLGNIIRVVFTGLPALAARAAGAVGASFSGGLVSAMRAGFAALPALVGMITSTFIGRLVAGAVVLTVGFNGVLMVINALSAAIVALISHPVALFLTGIGVMAVRLVASAGLLSGFGLAVSGLVRALLMLVGGPIGLALSALAFLAIKFNDVKDDAVKLGNVTTSIGEIIGAVWRLLSRSVGQSIDAIGGYFVRFGDWLSSLIGINDKTWDAIKSRFDLAGSDTDLSLKTIANNWISTFALIGNTVAIRLDEMIQILRSKMTGAVALARAAGQDIAAALSLDFSASNMQYVVTENHERSRAIHEKANADITSATKAIKNYDYVGAIVGSVVAELPAKAAGPVKPEERNPSTGGVELPKLSDIGGGLGSKGGKEPQESQMHAFEAALEEKKIAFEKSHALLEYSKQDEKAYWDAIIATYKGDSKTLADLKKKSANLELQIIRDNAKKEQELLKEKQEAAYNAATDQVAAKQAEAQQQFDMGAITQAQLLALEKQYAKESYEIALNLARQKRDLTLAGTVERAQAEEAILQVIRDAAAKDKSINNQVILERKRQFDEMFSPMLNAFQQMSNGIITGQQTLSNALRNMAQSITISYLQESLKQRAIKVRDWAFQKLGMADVLAEKKQLDVLELAWDGLMWIRKKIRKTLEWTWDIAGFAGVEATKKALKNAGALFDGVLWAKKKVLLAGQWVWEVLGFGIKEKAKTGIKIVSAAEDIALSNTDKIAKAAQWLWETLTFTAKESEKATVAVAAGVIQKLENASLAASYAAVAGAAASASAAAIPFIGWVIAPAAAAANYMAAMAYVPLAMAKGGEWEVGKDGSPYILHEKESVLPAGVADNFRRVVTFAQSMTNPADLVSKAVSQGRNVYHAVASPMLPPNIGELVNGMVKSGRIAANLALPDNLLHIAKYQQKLVDSVHDQHQQTQSDSASRQPVEQVKHRHELHIHKISADQIIQQGRGTLVKVLHDEHRKFATKGKK